MMPTRIYGQTFRSMARTCSRASKLGVGKWRRFEQELTSERGLFLKLKTLDDKLMQV